MPATDPLAELAEAVRRAPVDAQGAEDALKALAMASAMLGEAAAERMAGGPDSCAAALVGLLANPASPAILAEMAAMILTTLLNNSEPRCREVAAQGALPVLVAAMGRRDGDVAFAAAGAAFFLVDGCADLAGAMLEAGFAEAAAALLSDPALGGAGPPLGRQHASQLLQAVASSGAPSARQRVAAASAAAPPPPPPAAGSPKNAGRADPLAHLAAALKKDVKAADKAMGEIAMRIMTGGQQARAQMVGGPDCVAAALVGLLGGAGPKLLLEPASMFLGEICAEHEGRSAAVAALGAPAALVAAMGRREGEIAVAAARAAGIILQACDATQPQFFAAGCVAAAVAMLADPALGSAAQPRKDSHKCAVLLLQVLAAASGEQRAAVAAAGAVPLLQAEAAQSRCPYTQASAAHILSTLR
jgi:hypothetical protein